MEPKLIENHHVEKGAPDGISRSCRLRILSLCCLYPNPVAPGQGLFVQRRLQSLAELAEVKIVAPLAFIQYGNPKGHRISNRMCPRFRRDGCIFVLHPRWFYPPLSGIFTPFWLAIQLFFPLRKLRREFSFEVIDTHFGFPEGIAGLLLSLAFDVPFTMTFRGNEPKHSRGWLARSCMRTAVRKASKVFTVSERLRQFAIGLGAEPAKVVSIANGIEGTVFFPRDRAACRIKHHLDPNRRVILSAGALVERKGHHRVIQAFKDVLAETGSAQLVIAGGRGPEGEYEITLRKLVSELGLRQTVHFAGAVSPQDMAELMCAADVLCLASTNEGWPNVVHEALACGTPVVATDVGAVPEMLDGGRYGLIIPVGSQSALQNAIAEALRRDWDRSAISAWGRARGWREVALEVFQHMQTVAPETNKGVRQ